MIYSLEKNSITFEGLQDQDAFYQQASIIMRLLSAEEYQTMAEGSDVPDTIAFLDFARPAGRKNIGKYENLQMYLNENRFNLPWLTPEVRQRVMEVVKRHEAAEMWYIYEFDLQNGAARKREQILGDSLPHAQALLDEWRYAFELDCNQEYFKCIQHWSEEISREEGDEVGEGFLLENVQAYAVVAAEFGLDPAPLLPGFRFD